MLKFRDPKVRARSYSEWAEKQIRLAEGTVSLSNRARHIALANHYLKFAEREVVAAKRMEDIKLDHKA